MITHEILKPGEGGQNQNQNINDVRTGTWRVYFYGSNSDIVKEAYINRMDLKFKVKIDYKNIEVVKDYLEKWADQYSQNKKFEDIKNKINISKIKLNFL